MQSLARSLRAPFRGLIILTRTMIRRRNLARAMVIILIITPIFSPSYNRPPPHYRDLESRCPTGENQEGCANPNNETVFISVSLFDPGGKLVNGAWGKTVLELIHLIGNDNVFLSIYENDGDSEEEAALDNFRTKLRCRHALIHDRGNLAQQNFPLVTLPDGSKRLKRIAYLSTVRNRALAPLDDMTGPEDIKFDKILFLNDNAFKAIDAAHLLFNTNLGEDGKTHYLAACGLDYFTPFLYYDTFALRDAEGYSIGIPMFPIFAKAGRGISRSAVLVETDSVPVKSCWAGMVAV
ncbi:cryptococcal mannosyltransferase 1-domain-containing protein [Xylariaceae sp. FL0255]|nr:cryptococcal mannosyltransferase 1-domain-containing protein [Xylariaceae sp. FL0255]